MLYAVSDYPVGGCCVVFGVLLMVILENLSHHFLSTLKTTGNEDTAHEEGKCGHHEDMGSLQESEIDARQPSQISAADGHRHGCVAANTAANCWASSVSQGHGMSVRHKITAYMFELGCVVHSFLIGK